LDRMWGTGSRWWLDPREFWTSRHRPRDTQKAREQIGRLLTGFYDDGPTADEILGRTGRLVRAHLADYRMINA